MSKTAMVLVAHADDETLGCGGIIQKLLARGWRVEIVIMSESVVRARGTVEDNRAAAQAACAVLGAGPPRFMGFPDQRFDTLAMADLAGAVAALAIDPDLILTHVDADLNRDHVLTAEVARIVGRPRKKPVSILGCEIPNTAFWNGAPFHANYYVDVTNELETKIRAFEKYENEVRAFPHPWSREGLELLAKMHGMQCGMARAEAFQIVRAYEGALP